MHLIDNILIAKRRRAGYNGSLMEFSHLENVLCVSVTHFNVDLSQEVLQLFQGHHIVIILVCLPHAVDDPTGV